MLIELKNIAIKQNIPIMSDETIQTISRAALSYSNTNILELGSAIGYSALSLAHLDPSCRIVSIEKDNRRHQEALTNQAMLQDSQVTFVLADAKTYIPNQFFDVLIIDASKASNSEFFTRYFPYVKENGVVFVDNMDFHGFVENVPTGSRKRNLRRMVLKIKAFHDWINSQDHLSIRFHQVGDGLLEIRRKT